MDMPNTLNTSAGLMNRTQGQLEALEMKSLHGNGKMSDREMRDTANDFESLIIRQLLKEMRKTVPKSELMGNSHAMDMYMEIVDDHLAEQLAQTKPFGIGDMIYEELKEKNDKIKDPSEMEKKPFLSLNGKQKDSADPDFIPLHKNTEDFLRLHKEPQMLELDQEKNGFMELKDRRTIPTDKREL